jgi:hypothetical protein
MIECMPVHNLDRQITTRVPGALARAIEQRAEQLNVRPSDVARVALVREVAAPLDRRARSFVDAWLEGSDGTESQEDQ